MTIRPYTQSDFDVVTEIWLDSWRSTGIVAPVTLHELRVRWPIELAKGWVVSVAIEGDQVAGFLAMHDGCVEQLFIAPAHQGRGIGKHLLDCAKKAIHDGFYLTAALESRAGKFYEREGLTSGAETVHPRFGHRVIEYRWR